MLTGDEKLFYAFVYSFAERGCWQTDEQIGEQFGRSRRTIQRYHANCRKAGLFKVIGEGSKYRRIWAKDHPKFKAAQRMKTELLRQTCPGRTTDLSGLLRQTCPTTNKETNKTTNKGRGGSPSPAEQAHAPLRDKRRQLEANRTKKEAIASIEQLTRDFGRGPRHRPMLTEAELEARRQAQQRALLAGAGAKGARKAAKK
ncbi:MAG: hypothetical protein JSW66_08690 [Phycisphaerales bacterium]|nr:MAG: hypothetical protein JSW66_08690 [Phycisphaerales bacterium]